MSSSKQTNQLCQRYKVYLFLEYKSKLSTSCSITAMEYSRSKTETD